MESSDLLQRWLIYGSPSSIDCDVFVPITMEHAERLGQKSHRFVDLCEYLQNELRRREVIPTDKKLSVNVGILDEEKGVLVWSLKGGVDETNNTIVLQYAHHTTLQRHPLFIRALLPCNLPCRIMHTLRSVLGMLTRTQFRDVCKAALKQNTIQSRCDALKGIRLEEVCFAKNANRTPVDCWKTIAYKVGHVHALLLGHGEHCSKEDIALVFPQIEPFLMRADVEITRPLLPHLTELMHAFLVQIDQCIYDDPSFANAKEPIVWWS